MDSVHNLILNKLDKLLVFAEQQGSARDAIAPHEGLAKAISGSALLSAATSTTLNEEIHAMSEAEGMTAHAKAKAALDAAELLITMLRSTHISPMSILEASQEFDNLLEDYQKFVNLSGTRATGSVTVCEAATAPATCTCTPGTDTDLKFVALDNLVCCANCYKAVPSCD